MAIGDADYAEAMCRNKIEWDKEDCREDEREKAEMCRL